MVNHLIQKRVSVVVIIHVHVKRLSQVTVLFVAIALAPVSQNPVLHVVKLHVCAKRN